MSVSGTQNELHRTQLSVTESGGTSGHEVDATEDRRIHGIQVTIRGDITSSDPIEGFADLWMGGSNPRSQIDDDSSFIKRAHIEVAGTGESSARSGDGWMEFPDPTYLDWSEGETFNLFVTEAEGLQAITCDVTVFYTEV